MLLTVKGLIIKEIAQKENDKFITILTAEHGKMSVYCRGVRKLKSQFLNCIQLFCYNEFDLYEKNGKFWLNDCYCLNDFFALRQSLEGLALASYLIELLCDVTLEQEPAEEILRVALNSLYAICEKIKPYALLKAAFEFRIISIIGYMPDLECCSVCRKEFAFYYFDILNGTLICSECKKKKNDLLTFADYNDFKMPFCPLNSSVIAALKYILNSPANRFLLFDLPSSEDLKMLCRFTELYLVSHLERSFPSLEFYNSLSLLDE